MNCAHCQRHVAVPPGLDGGTAWCDSACRDAYYSEHPEEDEGWIAVSDLTPAQREQLVATLSPRPAVKA